MARAGDNARKALIEELNAVVADHFALYLKAKNFHWHVAGPRFHDLHLMFDDQATAIFALIDVMAERVRKLDGDTVTSIGDITRRSAVKDEDNAALSAEKMVAQLRDDNAALVGRFKAIKALAGEAGDNATEGLVDDWTDQAEQRVWFLGQLLR